MALSQAVLKQRIHAARLLRGLTQEQLNGLFEEDGLDKKAAGRIERGNLDMQRAHEDAYVRNLRVPRRWFTDEDVDALVGWTPAPELDDDQQAAIAEAARLLAEASHASDQAKPPLREASDGQGPNEERAQ